MSDHLIGLLLGAEEDWPRAFEAILRRVGPVQHAGATHQVTSERLTIEPFRLSHRRNCIPRHIAFRWRRTLRRRPGTCAASA